MLRNLKRNNAMIKALTYKLETVSSWKLLCAGSQLEVGESTSSEFALDDANCPLCRFILNYLMKKADVKKKKNEKTPIITGMSSIMKKINISL